MNAAEYDNITFGFLSLASQSQRITYKVGNILNLGALVTVGKDDSIVFCLQSLNFLNQILIRHAQRLPSRGCFVNTNSICLNSLAEVGNGLVETL